MRADRPTWITRRLPTIRTAGDFPHDDRGFERRHGPARYHALHLYDYPGTIRLGDRDIAFERGDVTITPAGTVSLYDLERPGRHFCVHFYPCTGAARGADRVSLPLHLSMAGRVDLARDKFRWIAYLWGDARRSPVARAGAAAAMLDLLLWLAACAQASVRVDAGPRTIAAVERAAQILVDRVDRPLDVGALGREVGVSRNYLARAFRARFGTTMARFQARRRMELAGHLLETTDLPVSLVGQQVGIDDPHYFNKQFRRALGMSPSAYRRRPA